MPIGEGAPGPAESGVDRLAIGEIEREIRAIADGRVAVEIQGRNRAVVYVDEGDISQVIGKGGGRISEVEDRLGISIDVRTHDARPDHGGGSVAGKAATPAANSDPTAAGEAVTPEITGQHVVVPVDGHVGQTVEIRADDEYLFTATVGRGGEIQVSRGSAIAEELEDAIDRKQRITVVPA